MESSKAASVQGGGTPDAEHEHPFPLAWETRDPERWGRALSADVVVHSPLLSKPFRGRAEVTELYATLFDLFGPLEFTQRLTSDASDAFYWRAEIDGRRLEGADFMTYDKDGRVAEIRVLMRPLVSLGVFSAAAGPAMARRDNRLKGALVRLLTAPIRLLFVAFDKLGSRLA